MNTYIAVAILQKNNDVRVFVANVEAERPGQAHDKFSLFTGLNFSESGWVIKQIDICNTEEIDYI